MSDRDLDLDLLAGIERDLAHLAPADSDAGEQLPFSFDDYERIVLFYSGGKDSLAAALDLIERGVPREKIELHHHCVDGKEGSSLMDWACTDGYVRATAAALGLKLYESWKVNGFEGELLRENCGTQPITFTRGDGTLVTMGGERSQANTRRKFPQVSPDLRVRWCSGVLKSDVGSRLLINDKRFTEGRTLVITGERAEESANRARYAVFEPDRADNRGGRVPRWIDHWRSVHGWSEQRVWQIIERHRILPHPAYYVGFGRCSCQFCVFLSSNAWATLRDIDGDRFNKLADYEDEFGVTIHRTRSLREQADRGTSFRPDPYWVKVALSRDFNLPVIVDDWRLPAGAYGENSGPC